MARDENQEIMTDAEFAAALADATAQGLIKWEGEDNVQLTEKGIDRALKLRESLGDTDYLLMQLFFDRINKIVEGGND